VPEEEKEGDCDSLTDAVEEKVGEAEAEEVWLAESQSDPVRVELPLVVPVRVGVLDTERLRVPLEVTLREGDRVREVVTVGLRVTLPERVSELEPVDVSDTDTLWEALALGLLDSEGLGVLVREAETHREPLRDTEGLLVRELVVVEVEERDRVGLRVRVTETVPVTLRVGLRVTEGECDELAHVVEETEGLEEEVAEGEGEEEGVNNNRGVSVGIPTLGVTEELTERDGDLVKVGVIVRLVLRVTVRLPERLGEPDPVLEAPGVLIVELGDPVMVAPGVMIVALGQPETLGLRLDDIEPVREAPGVIIVALGQPLGERLVEAESPPTPPGLMVPTSLRAGNGAARRWPTPDSASDAIRLFGASWISEFSLQVCRSLGAPGKKDAVPTGCCVDENPEAASFDTRSRVSRGSQSRLYSTVPIKKLRKHEKSTLRATILPQSTRML